MLQEEDGNTAKHYMWVMDDTIFMSVCGTHTSFFFSPNKKDLTDLPKFLQSESEEAQFKFWSN